MQVAVTGFVHTDIGDVKRLPRPPLRPEGLVSVHEVQRLRQQQQPDQSQLQVTPTCSSVDRC